MHTYLKSFLSLSLTCVFASAFSQAVPELYRKVEEVYNNGDLKATINYASEVDKFAVNRVDTLAANLYDYLADAYNQQEKFDKAIEYWQKEKTIYEKLQDNESVGAILYNISYAHLLAGRYEQASVVIDETLGVYKKEYGENSEEYARATIRAANAYIEANRFKEAENLLLSQARKREKNTNLYGELITKLGELHTYTGQYQKAAKYLQEATDVLYLNAGPDSDLYMEAVGHLGVLYMAQGKYPEAEEIFDVTLSLIAPDDEGYPAFLNNQALVYQSLGQLEKSEEALRKLKAIDSAELGTTHPAYAVTLSNLGITLLNAGKYDQAEKVLQEALSIQKQNKQSNTVSYGIKLNNLAKVYVLSGKPEKAIGPLKEALAVYKKAVGENHPEYANSVFNLGNAYWRSGNGKEGIKHLKTSASIRAKVLGKNHPKYMESVQKIAEYQWEQKQFKEAQQSFGEVFQNLYFQLDVIFPGLTEEEKSRFFYNNIKDSFEKFNSFAAAYASQDAKILSDMFNYHINTKGAIMYATEKVRETINASNDPELISLFEKWQTEKEHIARAFSNSQDPATIDSMMNAANTLEKELTKKSAAFAGQFQRKKYTWQDIQKALKPGEATVEVMRFRTYSPVGGGSFTEDVSYGFLIVTSGSANPQLVVMNKGKDMENKFLKFYHNSIRYNLDDPYSYKNYFEPLADALKAGNITSCYFSPDGVYNQLNLNSVYNPLSQKYLLDEYQFKFVTNSKELVEPRNDIAGNTSSILIGFPKFNLDKGEGTQVSNKTASKVTRSGNLTRGMRGLLRLMRGEEGIAELPGTQIEIQQISGLFDNNPKVFLEHQASEDVAKNVVNPTYLHIATHGYFLEDEEGAKTSKDYVTNPLLKAGLILAGSENFLMDGRPVNDAGDDGILTAYEAMNLKLDKTKLVVLSACETGLGQVKNGEGVYGLQRAFKLAGAQSIVMSLWSVDDAATQELMSAFYAELLKSGNQHEAFRLAQQKIKEKYVKPFYWGAFVMVGI